MWDYPFKQEYKSSITNTRKSLNNSKNFDSWAASKMLWKLKMCLPAGAFYPQNWRPPSPSPSLQSAEDTEDEDLYDFYYDDLEIR